MAETYNKLLVDVNAEVVDIITAVQDDTNSRYLDVVLYNNGVPIDLTGHEVRIYLRKPETNQEVWNDGEITDAVNGRCQFLMTTQALAEIGYLKAQISIWKDNTEILSTQIFNILVTESLRTTGSIESSNEYGALVVIFQNFYQAMDLMTTMVQNVGKPGALAGKYGLETMWQAWEYMSDYISVYLTNLINQALANASVQGVLDILGTTKDTGGSTTAGSTMAKLNAILSRNPSAVKSIQHGTIAFTAKTTTQTISAVDVTRAVVLHTGSSGNYNTSSNSGPGNSGYWDSRLTLKNATTVEAEVGYYNSGYNSKVSYVVIEFY